RLTTLQKLRVVILISCSFEGFKKGTEIKIVFPSLFGKCEINAIIENITFELFYILECKINSRENTEFFIEFENYVRNLINQKKRKEERILCTEKNLEKLRMDNLILLTYKYRTFKALIKDISYSGIKVLTNPLLLQTKDELFSFSIKFNNPEEKFFFVSCNTVRKQLYTFDNYNMAEIVFKLGENIKYRKRLDLYFNERKNINKR
ncbi:MAG: hypothetical protein IKK80_00115, partial [Treponema sp.]|nr:hypothetical protein [Treponema sp.]